MNRADLSDMMTAKDVARYLRISQSSGYNVMNAKGFPLIRIGDKRIICRRDDFLKWVSNHY